MRMDFTYLRWEYRKYQFMEANNQRRVVGLKDKIPDIQKTLETVRFLKTRKVRSPTLQFAVAFANRSSSDGRGTF